MKSTLFLLVFVSLSLAITAQDLSKSLEAFDNISISGSLEVDLYQGSPKANVTMVKGDIEDLKLEVKRSTLYISFKNKSGISWGNNRKALVDLYVQDLEGISVSAGSSVNSEFTIVADDFDANASSGATLSIALESKDLDADVSSGASLEIEGNSDRLNVDVSSGGSYKGKRLKAKDVDADVSSGGSIKVWVTDSLEADASSGGSIKYKGDPKQTDLDAGKWSGGSIKKM